jgi:O-antigen ligase
MFALPGILLLVLFLVGRPFDLIPDLKGVPLLYLFCAVALLGFALDVRARFTELRSSQHLWWVLAFIAWCVLSTLVRASHTVVQAIIGLVILFIVYLLLAQGIRTFKAFESLVKVLVACTLWIAVVTIHLGLQPKQCVEYWPDETRLGDLGHPDGRECSATPDCGSGDVSCEHVGLFGMTSVNGRTRYVGTLQDPNEVALFCSAMLPFVLALYQRKPSRKRRALALVGTASIVLTVLFTQSRGGVLVLVVVVALSAARHFGWRRLLRIGWPLVIPALLYLLFRPGREDAEASTTERLRCMQAGIDMLFQWPVLGAGFGQFTEHHQQTAHNSYLLAAAELGFVGLLMWATVFYISIKTVRLALRRYQGQESEVARTWGAALSTSLLGLAVGVFFLSFSYHFVLWIAFGMAGAFHAAIKTHDRAWRVPMHWRDYVCILGGCTILVLGLSVYLQLKLG